MPTPPLSYTTILFDWGDTVMHDDPTSTQPMVDWPEVRAVAGISSVLAALQADGRRIVLATSAAISDEGQICGALRRASLDAYFAHIYCFKNTQLTKGKAFYRHILQDLSLPAGEAVMIGDSFEKDVLAANAAGLFAIWYNPHTEEDRRGEMYLTVHSMSALLALFKS